MHFIRPFIAKDKTIYLPWLKQPLNELGWCLYFLIGLLLFH